MDNERTTYKTTNRPSTPTGTHTIVHTTRESSRVLWFIIGVVVLAIAVIAFLISGGDFEFDRTEPGPEAPAPGNTSN
jgi:hypothetical protein